MFKTKLIFTLLSLVFALGSCGKQDNSHTPDHVPVDTRPAIDESTITVGSGDSLTIGFLGDLSGPAQSQGNESITAFQLAVSDFGKINGRSVATVVRNTRCSAQTARAVTEDMLDHRPIGVVGTICSATAISAIEHLSGAGVFAISGANTSPLLTSQRTGNTVENYYEGYSRTSPNDASLAIALAELAEAKQMKRVVVAHGTDSYSSALADAFANHLDAKDVQLAKSVKLTGNRANYNSTIAPLAKFVPDGLFVFALADEATTAIEVTRNTSELVNLEIFTTDTVLGSDTVQSSQLDKVHVASSMSLPSDDTRNSITGQSYSELTQRFAVRSGEQPQTRAFADTYDATILLLQAIKTVAAANEQNLLVNTHQLLETLTDSKFAGVGGRIDCDEFGDCGHQTVEVTQLHSDAWGDGELIFTWTP